MKRLGIVLAAVAVFAAVAVYAFRPQKLGDGPLTAGTGGTSSGQRLAIGQQVSYGYVLLLNTAKKPATLESIRLLGVTGGLEVLGVRSRSVPDEEGRGMFISLGGYPPHDWSSTPLESNHVVPVGTTFAEDGTPNEGLELVIGVRASRPGVGRLRAVEFTYKVGGRRYQEVYDGSLYLCAPAEDFTTETCPGDARGRFDDLNLEFNVRN
jgi:hypothetical protein